MACMKSASSFLSLAPRAYLFTRPLICRTFSSTNRHLLNQPTAPFGGPSPPRLPKEEQEIFEELQRQSTGAFSTPREKPLINQSPHSSTVEVAAAEVAIAQRVEKMEASPQSHMKEEFHKIIEAKGKGEELHPNVRRGAQPEFEGDVNPKTGEVGGPKNDPLKWGAAGEWSYNGRTTDF